MVHDLLGAKCQVEGIPKGPALSTGSLGAFRQDLDGHSATTLQARNSGYAVMISIIRQMAKTQKLSINEQSAVVIWA
jgi:hypothetical protein